MLNVVTFGPYEPSISFVWYIMKEKKALRLIELNLKEKKSE